MGDPCNRGQMLGAKSSTRVHAAPGGQSSISLGWDEPTGPKTAPKINKAAIYNEQTQAPPQQRMPAGNGVGEAIGAAVYPDPYQQPQSIPEQSPSPPREQAGVHVSSNTWASNANQNCGNVLSERPTVRVRAPPGGKSSITF